MIHEMKELPELLNPFTYKSFFWFPYCKTLCLPLTLQNAKGSAIITLEVYLKSSHGTRIDEILTHLSWVEEYVLKANHRSSRVMKEITDIFKGNIQHIDAS